MCIAYAKVSFLKSNAFATTMTDDALMRIAAHAGGRRIWNDG